MSLGSALQVANQALRNTSTQTNILSRNVTEVGNENYYRRTSHIESTGVGTTVTAVRSTVDAQLAQAHLGAIAESEAQTLLADRLDQLNITINGIDGSRSAATQLTQLHASLQVYSANPSNSAISTAAIESAQNVVNSLNESSTALNIFRRTADADIAQEVTNLNRALEAFHTANSEVINGSQSGRDVNDALDQRIMALKEINKIVPVNVIERASHDQVLVAKDGGTLYEAIPRKISFEQVTIYNATTAGNPVKIDGVPVEPGERPNTSAGGSLAALLQMRDSTVGTIQNQLDEIARGVITAFAETDATNSALPDQAGLFTYSGGPGIPAAGTIVSGLASEIQLNAAYDPSKGGNPNLLRDGGANGASYVHNTTGAGSFSDHLISLVQTLDVNESYDSQTGIGGSMSILTFSSNSIGWLEGQRSEASQASQNKTALTQRLNEKISNQTGVNIDEEMSLLLRLEKSYEASARIITAIDEMISTLMNVAR